MKTNRVYISCTMRSGSSLLTNLLSVHSKVLVLSDRVHFFRHIYGQYDPLNRENVERLLHHLGIRMRYRMSFEFAVDVVLERIFKRAGNNPLTYALIWDEIANFFLARTNKEIYCEHAALQWREIPDFQSMFPQGKVIHLYRDPRGVLASWKKLSSAPNSAYLNCIFNWIDSINCMNRYVNWFDPDQYLLLKYEDLQRNPAEWIDVICKFIGIEPEANMLKPETWTHILGEIGKELVTIPRSAHEGSNIVGYSNDRPNHWQNNLDLWEIALVEFLAKDKLDSLGYECFQGNYSTDVLREGLKQLNSNPWLSSNLAKYLQTGEGDNKYPLDPNDPRSWGAPDNPSGWFVESEVFGQYCEELENLEKRLIAEFGN